MPTTYRQYYKDLIKELTSTEIKTRHKQFQLEISKRAISHEKEVHYIKLQDELNSLIKKCERFSDMVVCGKVSLSDEIDPDVLVLEVEYAREPVSNSAYN